MGVKRAVIKSDYQVITGHVDKSSKAINPKFEKNTLIQFEGWRVISEGFL